MVWVWVEAVVTPAGLPLSNPNLAAHAKCKMFQAQKHLADCLLEAIRACLSPCTFVLIKKCITVGHDFELEALGLQSESEAWQNFQPEFVLSPNSHCRWLQTCISSIGEHCLTFDPHSPFSCPPISIASPPVPRTHINIRVLWTSTTKGHVVLQQKSLLSISLKWMLKTRRNVPSMQGSNVLLSMRRAKQNRMLLRQPHALCPSQSQSPSLAPIRRPTQNPPPSDSDSGAVPSDIGAVPLDIEMDDEGSSAFKPDIQMSDLTSEPDEGEPDSEALLSPPRKAGEKVILPAVHSDNDSTVTDCPPKKRSQWTMPILSDGEGNPKPKAQSRTRVDQIKERNKEMAKEMAKAKTKARETADGTDKDRDQPNSKRYIPIIIASHFQCLLLTKQLSIIFFSVTPLLMARTSPLASMIGQQASQIMQGLLVVPPPASPAFSKIANVPAPVVALPPRP